jgi:putative transposase
VLSVLGCGPSPDADAVEIAVLRHQLAVLHRQVPRARYTSMDRMLLASLAKLLPRERWAAFLVTPSTLLRWHRQLVARRWTFPHSGGGRTGLDQEVIELVLRLARENQRWGYVRIVGECCALGVRGVGVVGAADSAPTPAWPGTAPGRPDLDPVPHGSGAGAAGL